MKIKNFEAKLVRNLFEYNKYLPEWFKEENPPQTLSMPLLYLIPEYDELFGVPTTCTVDIAFSMPGEVYNFSGYEGITVIDGGITCDFEVAPIFAISIPTDLGVSVLTNLKVALIDPENENNKIERWILVYSVNALLQMVDEVMTQQGNAAGPVLTELLVNINNLMIMILDTSQVAQDVTDRVTALEERVTVLEGA